MGLGEDWMENTPCVDHARQLAPYTDPSPGQKPLTLTLMKSQYHQPELDPWIVAQRLNLTLTLTLTLTQVSVTFNCTGFAPGTPRPRHKE